MTKKFRLKILTGNLDCLEGKMEEFIESIRGQGVRSERTSYCISPNGDPQFTAFVEYEEGDDAHLMLLFDGEDLSIKKRRAALEKYLIQKALERTGGNRKKAADILELSPRALFYKIMEYGLGGELGEN